MENLWNAEEIDLSKDKELIKQMKKINTMHGT